MRAIAHNERLDLVLPRRFAYGLARMNLWRWIQWWPREQESVPPAMKRAWRILQDGGNADELIEFFIGDDELAALAAATDGRDQRRGPGRRRIELLALDDSVGRRPLRKQRT